MVCEGMVVLINVVKSDTGAVLAVLPRYPWYYHGNGYKFYGITAVLGSKCMGIPWGWGPGLQYYRYRELWGWVYMDRELMHKLETVHLQFSVD